MQIQALPNTLVSTGFDAVRWPVTALGMRLNADDVETWPPVRAIDTVEAAIKETIGSLLHNDELIEDAQRARVRLERRRVAATLVTTAEHLAGQAADDFQERRRVAEQAREAAQLRAESRRTAAERERSRAKERAVATAASERVNVRTSAQKRAATIDKNARVGTAKSLDVEAKALQTKKAALAAKRRATRAEQQIETSRAARTGK